MKKSKRKLENTFEQMKTKTKSKDTVEVLRKVYSEKSYLKKHEISQRHNVIYHVKNQEKKNKGSKSVRIRK